MDSGGTTTNTYALTKDGEIIYQYKEGCGSPAVSKAALHLIKTSIENVFNKMKNHTLLGISLGISGIGAIESVADLANELKNKYGVRVKIVSDAEAALRSICDNDGIILIAGTGNACVGYASGVYHLTGGGGPLLDEKGSAYSFMQRAVMKMKERFEKGLPYSKLDNLIFSLMNLDNFPSVKTYFYNHTKADVASFTKAIINKKGKDLSQDLEIDELIKEQAQELALQAKLQYTFHKFKNKPILGLLGGFFTNNELLIDEIVKNLKNDGYDFELCPKVEKAYLGVLKIIKEENKDES